MKILNLIPVPCNDVQATILDWKEALVEIEASHYNLRSYLELNAVNFKIKLL